MVLVHEGRASQVRTDCLLLVVGQSRTFSFDQVEGIYHIILVQEVVIVHSIGYNLSSQNGKSEGMAIVGHQLGTLSVSLLGEMESKFAKMVQTHDGKF